MQYLSTRAALRLSCAPALLATLAGTAVAQNNINWLEFSQDNSLMVSASSVGLNDTEEKDYAWGDLDKDGWIDLVSVRKQPFTSTGRRTNVLFMNEAGMLVDRTSLYATGSDVPGDNGFATTTNDRDVVIEDVNADGWLDVITATTFSPNQTKAVSHPRVYINLGESGGVWLGLTYQEARIPNWNTYPNMCGLGVGDVNGDGHPDLYFSHYEQSANIDLNDRLLINDGNGYFDDESATRMSPAMRGSSFGTSASMVDMNNDGYLDILSVSGSGMTGGLTRSSIAYNDPNNEGFFNLLQEPYDGAPYHSSGADLNQDGLPDLIISDDAADRYLLNEGNDVFGRAEFSPAYTFDNANGSGDLGFSSNNLIRDLNGDGWAEAIFCDVDVDIPGCDRRAQIFHNRGGTVGGFVDMVEEAGSGSKGAMGLPNLTATHDIAIFDLDNDGDLDLVVGRCGGSDIFLNQRNAMGTIYCDPASLNSTIQPGRIAATGSPVAAANDLTITASSLPPNQFGYFLTSQQRGLIVMPGGSQGNLCLGGAIGRFNLANQIGFSGPFGLITLDVDTTVVPTPGAPAVILAGDTWMFTAWYRDFVSGSSTSNFTNAVEVEFR